MYTQHGHHIPFTQLSDKQPTEVANCGGPRICTMCTLETSWFTPALAKVARKINEGGGVESFQEKAKRVVFEYIQPKLEKTDTHITFGPDEVYIVWFSKTLQNWKALVSTTLPDGMYYEVTHNGDKNETYLDAYKKFDNVVIEDDMPGVQRHTAYGVAFDNNETV